MEDITGYKKPIKIYNKPYLKMMQYAQEVDGEISGLGFVNLETGIVDEVVLFDQQNSSVETDLDMDAVTAFMLKIVEETPEKMKRFRVWWHSHGTGSCYWSGQDEKNIRELIQDTPELISIVVNKKKEHKCRKDINFTMGGENYHIKLENLSLDIIDKNVQTIGAQAHKLFQKNITKAMEKFKDLINFEIEFDHEDDSYSYSWKCSVPSTLSEKEINEIKAEVKEKDKATGDTIITPSGLNQEVLKKCAGYSYKLKKWIAVDEANCRLYFKKDYNSKESDGYLQNKDIMVVLEENHINPMDIFRRKSEDIGDYAKIGEKIRDWISDSETQKLVDDDNMAISATIKSPLVANIFYSPIGKIFEDIDEAITMAGIRTAVNEVKPLAEQKFMKFKRINDAKAIAANEVLQVISLAINNLTSYEISELMGVFDFDNLVFDYANNVFLTEIEEST